jgi:predicted branched-subunit amino acid permease
MLLERIVHWNLDLDGDLYGDERERFRWYEGMSTAAMLQWLLVPWAAAILVWPLGKPSVLPLAVVLGAMLIPMMLCTAYVRSRRVDTTPRSWSAKRVLLTIIAPAPMVVFLIGAIYAYEPDGATWKGATVGAVIGAVAGIVGTAVEKRRRDRREAMAGDQD